MIRKFALVLALSLPVIGQNVCPRFTPGSTISPPEDLFSKDGILAVKLTYKTTVVADGNTRFCFIDANGAQSPTLHVNPGDRIAMSVTNAVPDASATAARHEMSKMAMSRGGVPAGPVCGSANPMSPSSVNVHFHGTNTPATCHQDEVIRTLINSGESFDYDLEIPKNEPPGLYWYHPHVHGISEAAVQGGASGAIIVEGIQNVNPTVAGLTQQLLVVRDNLVPAATLDDNAPAWDLSLNYVPIPYPKFTPAVIAMKASERQFWRLLNASADNIIDVQVQYDGQAQLLQVIALDGVPLGSQDGTTQGTSVTQTHILIPPAGRAEFVITGPSATVKTATLSTLSIDTGPDGDNDPNRPLASIRLSSGSTTASHPKIPEVSALPPLPRFSNLASAAPAKTRKLYFSEISLDPLDRDDSTIFFLTVDGDTPKLFDPENPPAIVTTAGTVEDWVVENRTMEKHEFHMHQIHFLVVNNSGTPLSNGQYLDTIDVPYWSGTGPYPSVTLRMDFRGVAPGDFVYHCHILAHEDGGMMATIRVNAASPPKQPGRK